MPNQITRTRIVRNADWDEYIVKAYVSDGAGGFRRYPEGDYFTDDREDARDTARAMLCDTWHSHFAPRTAGGR